VHGSDGMDEITLAGDTLVGELKDGEVTEYAVNPREFGLACCDNSALKVWDAAQAKDMLLGVLDNLPGPARDIVLLNAGAAIYAADCATTLGEGIERAREVIASGAAREKLAQLVEFSNRPAGA